MARIKEEKEKRLFVAETFRNYETQCAKDDFERDKSLAETEFEVDNPCTCVYWAIHIHMYMLCALYSDVYTYA